MQNENPPKDSDTGESNSNDGYHCVFAMKLIASPTIDSYFKFPDPYKDANDCVSQQGCGRIDRRCYHQNVTHQDASDYEINPFSVAISSTDWGKGTASEVPSYRTF